jgi:hypothetical protein
MAILPEGALKDKILPIPFSLIGSIANIQYGELFYEPTFQNY